MFKTSPLPFQGQKKLFRKQFLEIIESSNFEIYLDLFGGSGLLSHWIKNIKTDSRVIYNDFDNFKSRLDLINQTNDNIKYINSLIKDVKILDKIPDNIRSEILEYLKTFNKVDFQTLGTKYVFAGQVFENFERLEKRKTWRLKSKGFVNADNYLDGLEIFNLDYYKLYNKFKNHKNICFIIDPPYINTQQSFYKSELNDYSKIFEILENQKCVFFTSNKSNINLEKYNKIEYKVSNHIVKYTDIMFYNF